MSRPVVLSHVLKSAPTRAAAVDSVAVADRLGLPVKVVSANLVQLWQGGYLSRFETAARKDCKGRKRRTFCYYAAPMVEKRTPQPFTFAALQAVF